MPEYDVVFDISRSGYATWWFPLGGAVVFLAIVAFARFKGIVEGNSSIGLLAAVVVVFGSVWVAGALFGTYREYWHLQAAAESGASEMVEGPVEHVGALPAPADHVERLVVAGRTFEYDEAEATNAFNQTRRKGGPLRVGQWVRIWHVDGQIVRVAIRRLPTK